MRSFTYLLGSYRFHRIISDDNINKGYYFHEMFLRGRPGIYSAIKNQKTRALIDIKSKPNFAKYNLMLNHILIPILNQKKTSDNDNKDKKYLGQINTEQTAVNGLDVIYSVAAALIQLSSK